MKSIVVVAGMACAGLLLVCGSAAETAPQPYAGPE